MNLCTRIFLLLFISVSANAQSLHLQSGTIKTENNVAEYQASLNSSSDWSDGKKWAIIQFDEVPRNFEKDILSKAGIQLLEYIPHKAYIASIDQAADLTQFTKIHSVIEFTPAIRMKKNLADGNFPSYAIQENGDIELIVSWFQNAKESEVLKALNKLPLHVGDVESAQNYAFVQIDPQDIAQIANFPFVSFIEPTNPPETPDNYQARGQHRVNGLNTEYAGGRKYDGTGVVVAMGDDGSIGPHMDYKGRVSNSHAASDGGDHGDHVSGTIFGAGNIDPYGEGMAPGAFLYAWTGTSSMLNQSQSIYNTESVRITNVSQSNGCNSGYTNLTRTVDKNIRQTPGLLHVFSAGNEGAGECGVGGLSGTSYGAGTSWGTITGGHKMGKNCITVGSLTVDGSLSSFSSRGPATDGRIKPEVCGKGSAVYSCMDPHSYQTTSGTSMSAPGVAGACATLYHAYKDLNGGSDPESALIKAALMNTATDLGQPGPDFRFGFGEINAFRALTTMEDGRYLSDTISQGNTNTHQITVPAGTAELRVMLHWTDYEGATQSSVNLVNNLDFEVEDPIDTIWQPWVLDHSANATALNTPATRGTDNLNNQEQVTIEAPLAGTYDLHVTGTLIGVGPQKYYIVYEFLDSTPDLRYPIGGESFHPGNTERIRWDAPGDWADFTLEYSADNGSNWTIIDTVDYYERRANWQVPDTVSGEVLMRINRSGMSSQCDTTFSIIKRPTQFHVEESCPTSFLLEWNAVAGADYYVIYELGSMYMDSIDTTHSTQYWVQNFSQFTSNWFAVDARTDQGAKSLRTIAIEKTEGIWNCSEEDDMAINTILVPGNGLLFDCSTSGSVNVKVEVESYSPNPMWDIPVFYQVNGGTIVADTITDTIAAYSTGEWEFKNTTLDISNTGSYDIDAWVAQPGDQNQYNDSIFTGLEIATGVTQGFPYHEDFETFTNCSSAPTCKNTTCPLSNGWANAANNSSDDIDWRVKSGSTQTANTGPLTDKNPGQTFGKYLYTEASTCFGMEAIMISPCIDLSTANQPHVEFWFHLYGAEMGELHVDLFVDGEWNYDVVSSKKSDWSDKWWSDDLDLSPWAGKTVTLRWRGITGEGSTSDMALDDFYFYDASVNREPYQAGGIEVYPNPTNSKVEINIEQIANDGGIEIRVLDLFGKVMLQKEAEAIGGSLRTEVDLGDMSPALYLLEVRNASSRWTTRILKN